MNHIYRIVFNRSLGLWQAVAEFCAGARKGSGSSSTSSPGTVSRHCGSQSLLGLTLLLAAGQPWAAPLPTALPSGGVVTAGSAYISQDANRLTINQQTPKTAINWQSFDIGRDARVDFVQPSSSAIALNRVLGADGSQILGQLNANGQVFLINPNGVLFGQSASVNVGGLVASTLNLSDSDFMAGNYRFSGKGKDSSGGAVINQGTITAANGGVVALLGGSVSNQGTIQANLGTVALAAGNQISLDFAGDGLLNLVVDESALNAQVENRQLIRANGGQVVMTAKATGALLQTVVNNTGIVQAQTLHRRKGKILLLGGANGGTVKVAGTLDASAPARRNAKSQHQPRRQNKNPHQSDGGFIETSGANLQIAEGAVITAGAAQGAGGQWLIDPYDLTVDAAAASTISTTLNGGTGVTLQTTTSGTSGPGTPNAIGNGDIFINSAITWNANSTLTLDAWRSVEVNAAITATGSGAGLVVDYNQGSGITDGNFYANATVNLPVTGSLAINGQGYTLIDSLTGLGDQTGHYALVKDITTPINVPRGTLTGTFEGLGHTLSNLDVTTVQPTVGLFGNITSTGTVRNLTLAGRVTGTGSTGYVGILTGFNDGTIINVHANGRVDGYHFNGYVGGLVGTNTGTILGSSANVTVTSNGGRVGGLVGYMQAGSIDDSYANGSVSGGYDVGGLVGYMENSSINHSYATGAVSSANDSASIGGLVGHSHNHADISHAYATGNVTHHGPDGLAGGLVGFLQSYTTLDNVWASGTVSGGIYSGGLAGYADSNTNTATAAYWNTESTGQANALGAGSFGSATNVAGLTTVQMADKSHWTGFTFNSTPGGTGWVWLNGVRPMLTSEWSAYIRNAHQLQLMMLDMSANYRLGNDIDASATNGKDVWLGSSFASVGNIAIAFTGQLDGQGHSIDGLHVLRGSNNYTGLFGFIGNATLKDFSLTNATIEGQNYVGALAGYAMDSYINNVSASGTVTGNQYVGGMVGYGAAVQIDDAGSAGSVSGSNTVGGLVGQVAGASTLSNSQSSAGITGTGVAEKIGGLVGVSSGGASVSFSSASGNITGSNTIGGLVGHNQGTVADSSASGNIQAGTTMGGLVGHNTGTVRNSHATGNVSGIQNLGGLVGLHTGTGIINNSYAEGDVSGQERVGGLVGESHTTISGSHATGDVTASVRYAGGLVGMAASTSATIINSHATGSVAGGYYVGGLLGSGIATISNSYAQGTVSGNDALLGYVGGLAGFTSAAINSSHATGNVTYTGSGEFVGGLVGRTDSTITSSYASGDVSGAAAVGGLAGLAGDHVSYSHATGNVTGSGDFVGGLMGRTTGAITGSYASGEVSGVTAVGGLAGSAYDRNISNSYATGNVTGSGERVGGLLGVANGSAIGNSYATGNASGDRYVGGLVGLTNESSISNSYATGNATSTGDDVGGLVGQNGSTGISNSYASGNVSGVSRVGGLVGNNTQSIYGNSSDLTNSYASSRVTGSGSDIGGLVGKNREFNPHYLVWYDAGTITGSFWNLNTSGQTDSAGGTGVTTAQMQQLSTFVDAGWDISDQGGDGKVWRIYAGSTTPLLRSFMQQLTVTAPAGGTDKTYDGQIASGTLAGYTTSTPADASLLQGTLGYATTGANAGTYSTANGSLQLGGLHSTQQGYDIGHAGNSSLTINKAALTISSSDVTKTYDGTTIARGALLVSGGQLFGTDSLSGGHFAFANPDIGINKRVLVSDASIHDGNGGHNYSITYADNTNSRILMAPGTLMTSDLLPEHPDIPVAEAVAIFIQDCGIKAPVDLHGQCPQQ